MYASAHRGCVPHVPHNSIHNILIMYTELIYPVGVWQPSAIDIITARKWTKENMYIILALVQTNKKDDGNSGYDDEYQKFGNQG